MDVDAGTDDAWALFILLKAMDEGLCDIQAITCVHGNTQVNHVVKNVLRVLQTVGREKTIPVYKGCHGPLLRAEKPTKKFVHGSDGFGDLEFDEEVDLSLLQSKHAVNAIVDTVKENAGDIELVFVGPLTNLALAIRMYGKEVVDNVKDVWIMGGNYLGIGNITKSAEFNFYSDPEAAQIVLDSFPNCRINVLPWETCTERCLTIPVQWRFEELGAIENKVTKLMNAIDQMVYERKYFRPCDGLLAAVFLCPELVEIEGNWHATVELHGRHTRGQMVLDHLKDHLKATQDTVRIVEKINMEMFKKVLMWAAGHANQVCVKAKE